jgi:ribosomal protein S4
MTKFQKPRYKNYIRLSKDIYQTFNAKKFSLEKWINFKKKIRRKRKFFNQILPSFMEKENFFGPYGNVRLKKHYKFSLINKQKFTNFYRLQNYKLKNLVYQNLKKKRKIFNYLERRLDILLYKSGFFKTLYESKRFIHYQKISVNGISKLKPNHVVQIGDFIEINDSSIKNLIKNNLKTKLVYYFSYFKRKSKNFKNTRKIKIQLKNDRLNFNLFTYQFYSYFYFQKLIKKIRPKFKVQLYFPLTLEINYKTLVSICSVDTHSVFDLKKSFPEYLNFISLTNFATKTL